jgi:hypothetical protein
VLARALFAFLAALIVLGASRSPAPSKLAQLVSHHPLYPLLAQYDRQIAALRATETAPGTSHLASSVDASIQSIQNESANAQRQVNSLAANRAGLYQTRENAALTRLDASHALSSSDARARAGRELTTYRDQLARETDAMLIAYRQSIGQRTQRAFAERLQELREREGGFIFALLQRNAGNALQLRLKLEYLHLDSTDRQALQNQLSGLTSSDAARVAAMQKADAATLAAYQMQLQRTASEDDTRMASQLHAKAAANLALRRTILNAEAAAQAQGMPASIAARASAFRHDYNFTNDAASIASGFSQGSTGIAQHFAALKKDELASRAATDAAIASLQADRNALYRTIVNDVTHGRTAPH